MFRAALVLFISLIALPIYAGPSDRVRPLFDLLSMQGFIEIIAEEGVGYGSALEEELFPRRGGPAWNETVEKLYAPARLEDALIEELNLGLTDNDLIKITAFYESELGQRIVGLEVAARRAMMDDAVEDAASEEWMAMEERGDARWQLLTAFVEGSDLIEANVAGAMTSNFAFYQGLVEGHAFDFTLTEEGILADVWSQEDRIRTTTTDWAYSFASLAYQPLTDDEFAQYLSFVETPEGKALNAALLAAFNDEFVKISRELGFSAARHISGDDI